MKVSNRAINRRVFSGVLVTLTALVTMASCSKKIMNKENQPELSVNYNCGEELDILARYFHHEDSAYVTFVYDGESYLLPLVQAASGAKYAQGSDVWWSKGLEASFQNSEGDNLHCVEK